MANTTNFGWETPDDTDLVKDGAAAMRTLGNSIDASFVDLKGGTTGQILSKNSNTDLDFTWIANDQGDITAVTAGTGISGGGTSGAVTITNDMATTITAAGDIVVGTGSGTYDNLPIGTTGQVLTADTTVSPYKVKWAAASSGTPAFVGCIATKDTTDQTISNETETAVTFNGESIDTDGFHSTTTNTSRFTIPSGKAGKYLFIFSGTFAANATGVREVYAYKNGLGGTILTQGTLINSLTNNVLSIQCSFICDLTVGDYVEMIVWQTSGGNLALKANSGNTIAQMQYLGA